MATIVVECLDATVERMPYGMMAMASVILGKYADESQGERLWVKDYFIEGIHKAA